VGTNADLQVDGDHLVVTRKSMFRRKIKDVRRIPLVDVSAIRLQPAGGLQAGWLQVATLGAAASITEPAKAMADPNTVLFDKRQQEQFTRFAQWLNQVVEQNRAAGRSVASAPTPAGGSAASGEVLFAGMSHERGRNARVTLYRDRIERVKERAYGSVQSARQDVEVTPIRVVTSVQAKKDGLINTKVTVYASGNNIEFWFHHDEAARFSDTITQLILERENTPAPPVVVAAPSAPAEPDVLDQLRRLGELRDAGVLTPDEFESKTAFDLDLRCSVCHVGPAFEAHPRREIVKIVLGV
jgi:hypothetical protein